jgi:hypothetical protein
VDLVDAFAHVELKEKQGPVLHMITIFGDFDQFS